MTFRTATARARLAALLVAMALVATPDRVAARHLKLWPLFDYETDADAGTQSLKILGPILEYSGDPQYRTIAVRPFFSVRQARVGRDDEVRVLYPLITARWKPEEQTTRTLGGILTYRTSTTTDGKTLTRQRFRAVPFYFYDWDGEHGVRLSVPPLYADLEDVAGFERVQMVAFPAYLKLTQPEYDRRYWLYPFYSQVGGSRGEGWALWPAYGRMTIGTEYAGGFVAWPFYLWDEHTRDGATERRLVSFPFYSTIESPDRASTAYGTALWVHTVDRATDTESFAFPWPLWEYEKRSSTGATRTMRLLPFYGATYGDTVTTRIIAWPLYTERIVSDDVHTYRRRDGLLVLYHDERDTEHATGKTAHTFALVPGAVDEGDGTWDRGGAPALVDAMVPHDTGVREMYAPLWRAYGWDGPVATPRVSVLWGAVTRAGGETTYPWRWDPASPSSP